MFILKETPTIILQIFAIAACGYMLGRISFKGVRLGTAALFLTGLVFGHFGVKLPGTIQTMGLIFFIASVGMSAGPTFVERVRQNGISYIILCLCIALTGSLACIGIIKITGMGKETAVGMMTGAFTTSPGFAAAKEAVASKEALTGNAEKMVSLVAAGYGVAYPIGITGKVLYMQLVPRLVHADMEKERARIAVPMNDSAAADREKQYLKMDPMGVFPFSLAVLGGILLGSVVIPLPGGGQFSLGTTGGPLVTGLLLGHLGHLGPVEMKLDGSLVKVLKEIGLVLFFTGAGCEGGRGFAEVLTTYGFQLVFAGLILLLVPLIAGYLIAIRLLKLPLLNGLGAIAASMTCTPSLAILTEVAGTDDVAAAYAATYPFALISLVCAVQIILLIA